LFVQCRRVEQRPTALRFGLGFRFALFQRLALCSKVIFQLGQAQGVVTLVAAFDLAFEQGDAKSHDRPYAKQLAEHKWHGFALWAAGLASKERKEASKNEPTRKKT
jgi:hypothetical protein